MVGTGTGRDENGKQREFSLPTTISQPFQSLVSVPVVYHPVVRCLVLVPTVCRPTVRRLPDCFPPHRLPSCSHPIPTFAHNFSHPASTNIILGQLFPFHLPPVFSFPRHMTMDAPVLCFLVLRIQKQLQHIF